MDQVLEVQSLPSDLKANLRPHEQRLVMRKITKEKAGVNANLSSALGRVLGQTNKLCTTKASRELALRKPISCRVCKDKGFLVPELTARNQLNRRAYPCPACKEQQQQRYRESIRDEIRAGWRRKDWVMELGSREVILEHLESPEAKNTLFAGIALAKEFATNPPEGGILSLDGPPGTAKTHLLAKIYRYCTLKGLACIYLTGSDLQQIFTDFSHDSNGIAKFYQKKADLIASDILLIDEVDRISVKGGFGWSENELLDTIEKRINHKRPTALAGNKLSRLLAPVLSRCNSAGSYMLDMQSIPDGRGYFQGNGDWYKRALTGL